MHYWLTGIFCGVALFTGIAAARNADSISYKDTAATQISSLSDKETDAELLDDVQRRAFQYFWERADPRTGLVTDRARNADLPGNQDDYQVASIAATGYGLAALPVAVEHGWITRAQGQERAARTLGFVLHHLPHKRGWYYHFCDKRTGERVWKCEISSMDTSLLLMGALVCGQYFADEGKAHSAPHPAAPFGSQSVSQMANALYDRADWNWMRTRNGKQPDKLTVSHGWKPERGFLPYNWDRYSEGMLIYLLGLGARHDPLPTASWQAWQRQVYTQDGLSTLTGGPLFLHQMAQGFFDFRNRRDNLGYDYHVSAQNATRMHYAFCQTRADKRKTYALGFWGLNASDGPRGYTAYGLPTPEDGTVSPSGVLAAVNALPMESMQTALAMRQYENGRLWGKYGFADAFNVDKNWTDPDVIGIDLGMALLAIENHLTGLIWKLTALLTATRTAFARAGFHATTEAEPRALRVSAAHAPNARQDYPPGSADNMPTFAP